MQSILTHQYELLKSSRGVVFNFCARMKPEHYTTQVENFGSGGTIQKLQVHCANTYLYWLEKFAQDKDPLYFIPEEVNTVPQMQEAFDKVNAIVEEFLTTFDGKYQQSITTAEQEKRGFVLSPLDVFTHVITHEFHHKGQVMTMSRILGYIPVDADIIRLE